MGVGFQPRNVRVVLGIDEIHGFPLSCGRKELPVAGDAMGRAAQCGMVAARIINLLEDAPCPIKHMI